MSMGKRGKAKRKRADAYSFAIAQITPVCVECGRGEPERVTGADIYPDRPDLADKIMWRCECGAYVGSHPRTEIPLGHPCGRATQALRMECHALFDALWKAKMKADHCPQYVARQAGYKWLTEQLGIDGRDCHFGMFSAERCKAALAILRPFRRMARAS